MLYYNMISLKGSKIQFKKDEINTAKEYYIVFRWEWALAYWKGQLIDYSKKIKDKRQHWSLSRTLTIILSYHPPLTHHINFTSL